MTVGLWGQDITLPTVASLTTLGFTTWLNQRGSTITNNLSGVSLTAPAATIPDAWSLLARPVPTPPWTFTTLLAVGGQTWDGSKPCEAGIGFSDAFGVACQMLKITPSTSGGGFTIGVFDYTQVAGGGSVMVEHQCPWGTNPMWMQIGIDATGNITFATAEQGEHFGLTTGGAFFTTTALSGFLTSYHYMVIGASGQNLTARATLFSAK